ncbi:unnamed protein product [Mytilus coruscus]|uniref:Uncharacterized protein n=1 Tax=Mytilus coruscus TaxID=42192 RepID=A0A6J8A8A0_MYTCO|nr:unnamed protein product [Mytilus coruscus]
MMSMNRLFCFRSVPSRAVQVVQGIICDDGSTTISNATLYDIYVVCDGDKSAIQSKKYIIELYSMVFSFSTDEVLNKPEKGLLRIAGGKFQKFHPDSSSRVYLTILYLDTESRFKVICQGHEIPPGRNVVVTHAGDVKITKTYSTWEDEHGYDHNQDEQKVLSYKEEFETIREKYEQEVSKLNKKHKV